MRVWWQSAVATLTLDQSPAGVTPALPAGAGRRAIDDHRFALRDRAGDCDDLRLVQAGEDRQRADVFSHLLSDREGAGLVAEVRVRLGQVNGHRIVDRRRDTPRAEMLAQPIAVGAADDEQVVDVVTAVDRAG